MKLHINNLFWTFQGEGYHAGKRSLFVRMPFCNLTCPWCDTEFNSFEEKDIEDLRAFAKSESARHAVITGGEPMMHKHTPIVADVLKELGFTVATETNGMFPIVQPGIDWVTCSPKGYGKNPFYVHPQVWQHVNEWKYVVEDGFDFSLLDRHEPLLSGAHYYLSPEFGNFKASLARIFEYVKKNPAWRISLQTHKWMEIP